MHKRRLKKSKVLYILKYWSDGKQIWSSLLDQLYEQNIIELANSEGVRFQVGHIPRFSQKMALNALKLI